MSVTETVRVGDEEIILETGKIAKQAHGAVVVRHKKTMILATVVCAHGQQTADFFPLTVEYREKMAAGGKIPGNYFRREGRISEREILTSRLIDRSLRPLFPKGFSTETQVAVTVYSADAQSDLEGLGVIAAAAALQISDVPFDGPVAGLRLLRRNGRFRPLPNPAEAQLPDCDMDLVISQSRAGVVMLEGSALVVPDEALIQAIEAAGQFIAPILNGIEALQRAIGKEKKPFTKPEENPELDEAVRLAGEEKLHQAMSEPQKHPRHEAIEKARAEVIEALQSETYTAQAIGASFDHLTKQVARARILNGQRMDGRKLDEVRPITCEVGLLPANHGSALFTRGETQALVSATLGGIKDCQEFETLFGTEEDHFLLHYNFPPFSVGEVRAQKGPGRREIGHGNLARRALKGVMPSITSYPYTVRVCSDITESNGSSSMATVCGGCLALLNAGVPLKAPVAGIAMGLVGEGDRYAILTDILGDEDHLGDMDFKVAGPLEGITAVQMDNKLGSLPRELFKSALAQAAAGRKHILSVMQPTIDAQTGKTPEHAPRNMTVQITPSRIGQLIGPGGRTLQAIQAKTSAKIEVQADGSVVVMGKGEASARDAVRMIQDISIELEKGGLYMADVVSIKEFGAFVRIAEHEAMIHISDLAEGRVESVASVLQVGQRILVRVMGADEKGRLKLSRKAALNESELSAKNY